MKTLLRLVLAFQLCLGAGAALAADPPRQLGQDDRGRLVEQPRLTINMFELSDRAAEPYRDELRAYGKWVAAAAQLFLDSKAAAQNQPSMAGIPDGSSQAALRERTVALAALEAKFDEKTRMLEELGGRLRKLRPVKLQQPDIARAATDAAKDLAQAGRILGQIAVVARKMLDAVKAQDRDQAREALIAQVKGSIAASDWTALSTRRQIEAGVGGTPDLWIWRSQIEAAQISATVFRDLLHVLERGSPPPTIGQTNNHESLVAIAEYLKRAKIQARHELKRAQSSPEASPTRGRWLEAVYRNYERAVAAEQATYDQLQQDVPRFYAVLRADLRQERGQVTLFPADRYEELDDLYWTLTAERYRLLASMP